LIELNDVSGAFLVKLKLEIKQLHFVYGSGNLRWIIEEEEKEEAMSLRER